MKLLIDKKSGKKMYPVGRFDTYQHVLFNYNDRCYNAMVDSDYSDDACEKFKESERLLDVFNNNVTSDGMVFALYADYKLMKDIIGGYAWRHGGYV